MDSKPAVRQALPADMESVKRIIDLSLPRFFRYFASHSVDSKEGKVLIFEKHNDVAGFAKLIEFKVGNGKYGCILWIAVHPDYRRRGIAFNLTNESGGNLKKNGVQAVFASTQRKNSAAKKTLTKASFRQVGFLGLWRVFGWRVFSFYRKIWYAPSEIVYMKEF